MYATNYAKASDIADAVAKLATAGDGKLLAGGQTLLPTLKQRLASPDQLIDLAGCGLSSISTSSDAIKIGAMTCHADVAEHKDVAAANPGLAALAGGIGDRQVRNCGTIGGSVANNDPAACYPSALLALRGTIHTNRRDIAADEFFTGMFETALDDDEVITAITLPNPQKSAYVKFPNPASRYAMVGVFVAKFADGVRVAVTGAGEDGVFRANNIEAVLSENFDVASLEGITMTESGLVEDIHASPAYRAHLIVEMARRAVAAC
jgi:carbon-monoxide dehydrogenase medium subunit